MNETLTGQEPESVTILQHSSLLQCKRYDLSANGSVVVKPWSDGANYSAEVAHVSGLRGLHDLLTKLEQRRYACIIRAAPFPETNLAFTRRLLKDRIEKGKLVKATFFEVPRSWVQLDVDKLPLPAHFTVLRDYEDVAQYVLAHLVTHLPELAGAGAVVQFSSSAGLIDLAAEDPHKWAALAKPTISAHVWVWLDRPMVRSELEDWLLPAIERGASIDPALLRPVQAHYTAAPYFSPPLYDPLAGRRTLLIPGGTVSPVIPEPEVVAVTPRASKQSSITARGGSKKRGLGYQGHLAAIGPAGFRDHLFGAAGIYVKDNWPDPDLKALKDDLQGAIWRANPGHRTDDYIRYLASDEHLDSLIQHCVAQERLKDKAKTPDGNRLVVPPTHRSRKVSMKVGQKRISTAIDDLAERVARGERPAVLLRVTVGGGKSIGTIAAAPRLARAVKRKDETTAIQYAVPRHELTVNFEAAFKRAAPHLKVATLRGMNAPDPLTEGAQMCLDPDLPAAARRAGVAQKAVCAGCVLADRCGANRQLRELDGADVVVTSHNALFHEPPPEMPPIGLVIVDESFHNTGLQQANKDDPHTLDISALLDTRTGTLEDDDADYLRRLRRAVFEIVSTNGEGGLFRDRFVDYRSKLLGFEGGFGLKQARDWSRLEWGLLKQNNLKFLEGTPRQIMLDALASHAQRVGNLKPRAQLASFIVSLLTRADVRSVNALVQPGGTSLLLEWRMDFIKHVAEAPKLFLDATGVPEIVKQWAPALTFEDIEIEAPKQRVRQIVGGEFGKNWIAKPENQLHIANLAAVELAAITGKLLIVVQKEAAASLRALLAQRLGAHIDRVAVDHHGNLSGLNKYGTDFESEFIVGRAALNRVECERLAEIIKGGAVNRVQDGELLRYPMQMGGIRMADGTGRAISHPHHPDPLVEAVRWSISEGGVEQANRLRGVRRAARLTFINELPLTIDVHEVAEWSTVVPDRLTTAIAGAILEGRAMPFAPAHFIECYPNAGFETEKQIEHELANLRKQASENYTPNPLYMGINRGFGVLTPRSHGLAEYRRKGQRGPKPSRALVPFVNGREALEAEIGELSTFKMLDTPPVTTADEAPAIEMTAPFTHRDHVQMGRLIWEHFENMQARSRGEPPVRIYEHVSPPS